MYVLSDSLITLSSIFNDIYVTPMLMLEDEEALVGDDIKLSNIP